MRIGDQLELVTNLKGKKNKAARSRARRTRPHVRPRSEPLWRTWGSRPPTQSTRARCRAAESSAAIARAFIGNPQLILADEPTAGLDPDRGQEIDQLVCKAVKSKNESAIMVVHDRSILPYVDMIYELTHGTPTRLAA